jgi:hypothetical protein
MIRRRIRHLRVDFTEALTETTQRGISIAYPFAAMFGRGRHNPTPSPSPSAEEFNAWAVVEYIRLFDHFGFSGLEPVTFILKCERCQDMEHLVGGLEKTLNSLPIGPRIRAEIVEISIRT